MYQIKRCPFCCGRPYLEDHSRGFINGVTAKLAYVRCTECNARGERFNVADFGSSSWSAEASRRAVESWNSRAENSEETFTFEGYKEKRARNFQQRMKEQAHGNNG